LVTGAGVADITLCVGLQHMAPRKSEYQERCNSSSVSMPSRHTKNSDYNCDTSNDGQTQEAPRNRVNHSPAGVVERSAADSHTVSKPQHYDYRTQEHMHDGSHRFLRRNHQVSRQNRHSLLLPECIRQPECGRRAAKTVACTCTHTCHYKTAVKMPTVNVLIQQKPRNQRR
jgi:hypothetical protein